MTGHHLEVVPLSRQVVRYESDVTPLAEHPTQADAVAEARNWADLEPELGLPALPATTRWPSGVSAAVP